MASPVSPWDPERATALAAEHVHLQGATLPILHAFMAEFGHVPAEAVPIVADALNMSRAEVFGCLSFYHDFRREPAGRHVVKLCRAEACQAVGADALHADMKQRLGIGWHETTPDGALTLEPVFCLGLCASGPAALVDDEPVCRFDAVQLQALVEQAA